MGSTTRMLREALKFATVRRPDPVWVVGANHRHAGQLFRRLLTLAQAQELEVRMIRTPNAARIEGTLFLALSAERVLDRHRGTPRAAVFIDEHAYASARGELHAELLEVRRRSDRELEGLRQLAKVKPTHVELPENLPRPWSPCSGPDCTHPSHDHHQAP